MRIIARNSVYVIFTFALLSGCASIIHGPSQTVDFTSQPANARIMIDGEEFGSTPMTAVLKRKGRTKGQNSSKKEYAVRIELEGYHPYEMKIKREMDGWFLGNIVIGGLIGIIIDAANGSMYKLNPDQVIAQMGKTTAMRTTSGFDDKIYVAVTLEVDESWEKVGTLERCE